MGSEEGKVERPTGLGLRFPISVVAWERDDHSLGPRVWPGRLRCFSATLRCLAVECPVAASLLYPLATRYAQKMNGKLGGTCRMRWRA